MYWLLKLAKEMVAPTEQKAFNPWQVVYLPVYVLAILYLSYFWNRDDYYMCCCQEYITEDQYCANYGPYLYTLTSAKYVIDLECLAEPKENVGGYCSVVQHMDFQLHFKHCFNSSQNPPLLK